MEKENMSQKYANLVDCYLITSDINGIDIIAFWYGYNLYMNAKRMQLEETASKLGNYLVDATIDEITDNDSEIIEIKEYIKNLEGKSNSQSNNFNK